jgi:hypothetical protein
VGFYYQPNQKDYEMKNWKNGSEQVIPSSGDDWARLKTFKDPVTGKDITDIQSPQPIGGLDKVVNKKPAPGDSQA